MTRRLVVVAACLVVAGCGGGPSEEMGAAYGYGDKWVIECQTTKQADMLTESIGGKVKP